MTQKSNSASDVGAPRELFARALQQHQLGQQRLAQGQAIDALEHFQRALALNPNSAEAFNDLAQTLFVLAERGHAADVIMRNPLIRRLTARAKQIWPARLDAVELHSANAIVEIANDSFLLFFLGSSRLRDAKIEQFLTGIRAAMLARALKHPDEALSPPVFALYCALARQCFINEYVFSLTADEKQSLAILRERIDSAVAAGTPVPAHLLAIFACYFPLNALAGAEALLKKPWPAAFRAILIQQVEEPLRELQLRKEMPRLTEIDDAISLKVRGQYEESPYPRWMIVATPSRRLKIDEYLRLKYPHAVIRPFGKANLDLLVAGCGTGHIVAGMAQILQGARVLAVDLSLASLGYAKRMCEMLGLRNIEFGQADILKISSIGRKFDAISTTGVLHHMADPLAAWEGLVSILRPGGFMHVGLYSEIARQNVSKTWKFIADGGYGKSADEIRRCREDIFALPDEDPNHLATLSSDFYSLSDCRDLLFHEHELRLTLPQIRRFLAENRLEFIGWDIDGSFLAKYEEEFPEDNAKNNLDNWQTFEEKYPYVFSSMYTFWVQKRA